MSFYYITSGSEFNSLHFMSNLRHIREGHLLPLGGNYMLPTANSYSLGDSTYWFDGVSCSSLHISGAVALSGTESSITGTTTSFSPLVMVREQYYDTGLTQVSINIPSFGWAKHYTHSQDETEYAYRHFGRWIQRGYFTGPSSTFTITLSLTSDMYTGTSEHSIGWQMQIRTGVIIDTVNNVSYIANRNAPINCTFFTWSTTKTIVAYVGSITGASTIEIQAVMDMFDT